MLAFATFEYATEWTGIPIFVFVFQTIGLLVLQLLVTFALVIPIVTTIVAYHARGMRRR